MSRSITIRLTSYLPAQRLRCWPIENFRRDAGPRGAAASLS